MDNQPPPTRSRWWPKLGSVIMFFKSFIIKHRLPFVLLFIAGLYVFLYQSLYNLGIAWISNNLFQLKEGTTFADTFWSITGIACLVYLLGVVIDCYRNKKPVTRDFYLPLFITIVYVIHRFNLIDQHFSYTHFRAFPVLAYTDIVFIFLLLLAFKPQARFENREKFDDPFIEDNHSDNGRNDVLKRGAYAEHIANLLNRQHTERAFAVAVTGDWGSGKSVFLDQVRNKIENSIVIEFNPWLSGSTNMVQDFLAAVAENVKPYNKELSKKFVHYSSTILAIEENIGFKISRLWRKDEHAGTYESIQKQRKELLDSIRDNNLRFVFMIDDLDRVSADEAMSIFSLIRNIFDFPNVFFIVAFDYSYVLELLSKKEIPNPERYFHKIFQVDIGLPSFPPRLLKTELLGLLSRGKTAGEVERIGKSLDVIDAEITIEQILVNIRGCIRFANSFNHVYEKKINQVDLTDYFALELLRCSDKKRFDQVRKDLTSGTSSALFEFDNGLNDVGVFKIKIPENEDQVTVSDRICIFLFNRSGVIFPEKSIRVAGNAIRYFSDHLFGAIDFSAFDVYKEERGEEKFQNFLDEMLKKNLLSELMELLRLVNTFSSKESFKAFIAGIMYLGNKTRDIHCYQLVLAITKDVKIEKGLFANSNEFLDFVYNLLQPREFPYFSEFSLGADILMGFFGGYHVFDNRLDKDRVRDTLVDILQRYTTELANERYDPTVYHMHHRIIKGIAQGVRNIITDERADQITRKYLELHPTGFLTSALIVPHGDQYTMEAFILDLYRRKDFEHLLFGPIETTWEVLKFQTFYRKYKQAGSHSIKWDPHTVTIPSDRTTMFTHSPDYPDLTRKNAVIRTNKVPGIKLDQRLEYSQWISETKSIPENEARNGGHYYFEKRFTLGSQKIIEAEIVFGVDDWLTLTVNNQVVGKDYHNYTSTHIADVRSFLQPGENVFVFEVRNKKIEAGEKLVMPEHNPYEFIFCITIVEESPSSESEDKDSFLRISP